MSVQVQLHVLDNGVTEADVIAQASMTLGSKYFSWAGVAMGNSPGGLDPTMKIAERAPGVVVGDRSAFDGADDVSAVMEAVGEDFPEIDDDLTERVLKPLLAAGNTETAGKVDEFLHEHRGKRAFVVAW